MLNFRQQEQARMATGKVDGPEVETLRRHTAELRLEVSGVGGRTVARVAGCRALTEGNVEALGRQLSALTAGREGEHLLLDLGAVSFLTSTVLGELIGMHKRVRDGGGRLTLANVQPMVREVFAVTCLDRVLEVRPEGGDGDARGVLNRMDSRHIEECEPGVFVDDADMVERVLLLRAPQAERSEQAATRHGLTVGRLFRRLINEFLEREAGSPFSHAEERPCPSPPFVPERNKERTLANTAKIRKQMEVLGSCGNLVGIVAALEGTSIKLARHEPGTGGVHRYLAIAWVESVGQAVHLNKTCQEARESWLDVPFATSG
jgi:anti-anti-sigma factor